MRKPGLKIHSPVAGQSTWNDPPEARILNPHISVNVATIVGVPVYTVCATGSYHNHAVGAKSRVASASFLFILHAVWQ